MTDEMPEGVLICCLDDSDGARRALAYSRTLATRLGLELVLLHVEPSTDAPGLSAIPAGHHRLREEEKQDGHALLSRLGDEAGLGSSVRHRVAIGKTGDAVAAACSDEKASLVVLGARGRGSLRSALLGSVSSEVAARVPCACVIVPQGAPPELRLP